MCFSNVQCLLWLVAIRMQPYTDTDWFHTSQQSLESLLASHLQCAVGETHPLFTTHRSSTLYRYISQWLVFIWRMQPKPDICVTVAAVGEESLGPWTWVHTSHLQCAVVGYDKNNSPMIRTTHPLLHTHSRSLHSVSVSALSTVARGHKDATPT
jgi:hypothetical protein